MVSTLFVQLSLGFAIVKYRTKGVKLTTPLLSYPLNKTTQ